MFGYAPWCFAEAAGVVGDDAPDLTEIAVPALERAWVNVALQALGPLDVGKSGWIHGNTSDRCCGGGEFAQHKCPGRWPWIVGELVRGS